MISVKHLYLFIILKKIYEKKIGTHMNVEEDTEEDTEEYTDEEDGRRYR